MFLKDLSEREKYAFLDLAHMVANADDDFCYEEQELIRQFKREMSIEEGSYEYKQPSLNYILGIFQDSKSQNIVFMETLAVVYADGVYHPKEKEIIDQIVKAFNLNENKVRLYENWILKTIALYSEGYDLVNMIDE